MVVGEVGEETFWLVCGLWLASGTWQRARGSSAELWGWGGGSWPGLLGQPTEYEGWESRAWVLSWLSQ